MKKSPEVDSWFAAYKNPQKELMQRAREIILGADARVEECVKWKTPTFTFKGNIASFNPRATRFVSLMFHTGATIPGKYSRMSGSGDTARYMQFTDAADLEAARPELEAAVRAWCKAKAT